MSREQTIKDLARDLGADLCGIAPVGRFRDAPAGFWPQDVFPQARSVVALAKRFPEGPFHSRSPIPYTSTSDVILQETTRITTLLCVNTCPVHAIHDRTVTQKLCRGNCEGKTAKGYSLYVCNACRRICPNGAAQTRGLKDPGGSGISVRGCTR